MDIAGDILITAGDILIMDMVILIMDTAILITDTAILITDTVIHIMDMDTAITLTTRAEEVPLILMGFTVAEITVVEITVAEITLKTPMLPAEEQIILILTVADTAQTVQVQPFQEKAKHVLNITQTQTHLDPTRVAPITKTATLQDHTIRLTTLEAIMEAVDHLVVERLAEVAECQAVAVDHLAVVAVAEEDSHLYSILKL